MDKYSQKCNLSKTSKKDELFDQDCEVHCKNSPTNIQERHYQNNDYLTTHNTNQHSMNNKRMLTPPSSTSKKAQTEFISAKKHDPSNSANKEKLGFIQNNSFRELNDGPNNQNSKPSGYQSAQTNINQAWPNSSGNNPMGYPFSGNQWYMQPNHMVNPIMNNNMGMYNHYNKGMLPANCDSNPFSSLGVSQQNCTFCRQHQASGNPIQCPHHPIAHFNKKGINNPNSTNKNGMGPIGGFNNFSSGANNKYDESNTIYERKYYDKKNSEDKFDIQESKSDKRIDKDKPQYDYNNKKIFDIHSIYNKKYDNKLMPESFGNIGTANDINAIFEPRENRSKNSNSTASSPKNELTLDLNNENSTPSELAGKYFMKFMNLELVSLMNKLRENSSRLEPMRSVIFRRLQYLVGKTFTGAPTEIT